ncbi:MAG TPA: hypothetical protein VF321_05430 [Gaiellaceae bacterium]
MGRPRTRQRLLAGLALGLLALIAELGGRSLTHRLDVGRRVGHVSYAHADYYPFLLAGVKIAVALMLARLAWRVAKAHAAARAARRFATALGARSIRRAPRVRIELSWRLWLLSFVVTASIYLVQADAEQIAAGSRHLLGPWLHSSALPVFAVLSVIVAVVFRTVELWLSDYEELAADAIELVRRLTSSTVVVRRWLVSARRAPRSLFGLAFESRPPPLSI